MTAQAEARDERLIHGAAVKHSRTLPAGIGAMERAAVGGVPIKPEMSTRA